MTALKIHKDEIKKLRDLFLKLDKDKDGHISKKELKSGYGDRCMFDLMKGHVHNSDDPDEDFDLLMG